MLRVIAIAVILVILTLALLPVQLVAVAFNLPLQRRLPVFFHRIVCGLIGVRIREVGRRSDSQPLLVIANHASWLDICVISAVAPVVFVAKQEVSRWPIFGTFAKLQRSVFIDRERRQQTAAATGRIAERLLGGDVVVLFAEGTSSDGNRVLPFRSALVGAVHQALAQSAHGNSITVQPMSIAYLDLSGLPISRAQRSRVAWYGAADLLPHLRRVLACGAIDVTISWGEAVAYDRTADRKDITRDAEAAVRRMTSAALRSSRSKKDAPAGEATIFA